MVDLHTHTTHSDGTFEPEQLIRLAEENSLRALAITDHDTVDAIAIALEVSKGKKVKIVSGVELSVKADLPINGHLHLLGLFVDHENTDFCSQLDYLRSKRTDRVYAILDKLNELDFPLSTDDLHLEEQQVSIGRPHIARMMANYGYVTSIREAFDLYLGEGKPAFVEKEMLSIDAALELIHSAGGLAIMAHPVSLAFSDLAEYGDYIKNLKASGMDGIEVYSSFHPPEFITFLEGLAKEEKLCISGGSDFHGANKPEIILGRGLGNLAIPDKVLAELERVRDERQKAKGKRQKG